MSVATASDALPDIGLNIASGITSLGNPTLFVKTDTALVIISNNPDDPNNIKAAADYVDTIHYEVACLLNDRLPRVYYED